MTGDVTCEVCRRSLFESHATAQVSEARWCYRSQAWSLSLSTGERWTGDMIWLATGCKLDVRQDPLLSEVMREFPTQVGQTSKCVDAYFVCIDDPITRMKVGIVC